MLPSCLPPPRAAPPQSSIPSRIGCSNLYVTHQLGNRNRIRPAQPRRFAIAGGGDAAVSAAAAGDPQMAYSVLGQGYNALTGLPVSVGMSSLDPGFS